MVMPTLSSKATARRKRHWIACTKQKLMAIFFAFLSKTSPHDHLTKTTCKKTTRNRIRARIRKGIGIPHDGMIEQPAPREKYIQIVNGCESGRSVGRVTETPDPAAGALVREPENQIGKRNAETETENENGSAPRGIVGKGNEKENGARTIARAEGHEGVVPPAEAPRSRGAGRE